MKDLTNLREMNVSLPQDLMYPVEKWGRPAASVKDGERAGGSRPGNRWGRGALGIADKWIRVPRARDSTRFEPEIGSRFIRL